MKNIIARKLSLNVSYTLTDKKYISLTDGFGCTCDNCGKLIANIATVNDGNKSYNIGFDCLDTILQNNAILSDIDIADYQQYKAALSKIMKFIKRIKEVRVSCKSVTGIKFEVPKWESDYHNFHWLHSGSTASRDNDYFKCKGITFDILFKVISDYFKDFTIIKE